MRGGVRAKGGRTLRTTIVTIFSHITGDVSVFLSNMTQLCIVFWEITTNSNF